MHQMPAGGLMNVVKCLLCEFEAIGLRPDVLR